MLKGNRKYFFFLIACFAVLIFLQLVAPRKVDWKLSYLKKDKIPYGTAAVYEMLPFMLSESTEIQSREIPLYNVLNNKMFDNTLYLIINEQFEADKLDVRELMNFVESGNTAFISANYFSESMEDTLGFGTNVYFNTAVTQKQDSINDVQKFELHQHTGLNLYNPTLRSTEDYQFETIENTYFDKFDSAKVIVLGSMDKNKINFIKINHGKGSFYLHSTPEAFTNINFLKSGNATYAEKIMSMLPSKKAIWDEYYKAGKIRDDNPLHVIMSHAPLATAYYVLLFSLLAFILIGIKRKQRIIPVMEPMNNTTLDFVTTIGTLYYQQGSHKEIAEKQIVYFQAFLRSKFRIATSDDDKTLIARLSGLSGIDRDHLEGLIKYINYIREKSVVYEQELLQLNKMIEAFHHLNKRT